MATPGKEVVAALQTCGTFGLQASAETVRQAFSVSEPRDPFALRLDTKAKSALLACADADVRDQRLQCILSASARSDDWPCLLRRHHVGRFDWTGWGWLNPRINPATVRGGLFQLDLITISGIGDGERLRNDTPWRRSSWTFGNAFRANVGHRVRLGGPACL
jgi:hypothetical protein